MKIKNNKEKFFNAQCSIISLFFSYVFMADMFLETKNFTISSTGRQVHDEIGIVNGKRVSIQVKINPEGDVREYVSGVPAACIGQQLFTFTAAIRETQKAGKSLPADQQSLHEAIASVSGDTELQKYKNYFSKTNVQLAGCYASGLHVFDDV